MSIKLVTKAWETCLPMTRKIVLLALADAADESGICRQPVEQIASKCCLSKRTVLRCLAELEGNFYIKRTNQSGKSAIKLLGLK
jgi:CTP-dependent riboflavin kinase